MTSQPTLAPPVTHLVQTSLRLEAPQRMTMMRAPSTEELSNAAPSRQTMLRRPA